MSDAFTLAPAGATYVARAGGAVIAETDAALILTETGYDPVVYFPRDGVGMAFLEASDRTTTCPHKGAATYYHIAAKSGLIEDAAWSYEAPIAGAEAITGHIAFGHDRVFVEKL
ncbi:MAG: DUF427 domain-containing protein [Paracoccaceae bacterium]